MANPLEWTPAAPSNSGCPYDHTRAKTPFGDYLVTWKSWKDYPSYGLEFADEYLTTENTLPDAKLAAQEDFDRRVAASVAPTPS